MTQCETYAALMRHQFPDRALLDLKILDFGCGSGGLVRELLAFGLDVFGCEIAEEWTDEGSSWNRPTDFPWRGIEDRCGRIGLSPYRLPFDDGTFDVVLSNHVFEHVQNKREAFLEIRRVSKPGAVGIHLFPSKYMLPTEPHIFVPFSSWIWPNVPDWWFNLWAALGVRNKFQEGLSWRETAEKNRDYFRFGVSYAPLSAYRAMFQEIFGEFNDLSAPYLSIAPGGAGRLIRSLPMRRQTASIVSTFRERCISHRLVNAGA